jgi:tRNA modification GTPase
MKHGIPVAIVGKPNVGKSTLLNLLLNEDRALVSEIPGTTRDAIEDVIIINGTAFRFIDTAGLREARDTIEQMGIEKTYEKIELASIVLYVFDISNSTFEEVRDDMEVFSAAIGNKDKKVILIGNMIDKLEELPKGFKNLLDLETVFISAKKKENITAIFDCLATVATQMKADEGLIVSNARHYEALVNTQEALVRVESGIQQKLSGDLVAQDLREALYYLGLITGEIASEEILGSIFRNFCIGK